MKDLEFVDAGRMVELTQGEAEAFHAAGGELLINELVPPARRFRFRDAILRRPRKVRDDVWEADSVDDVAGIIRGTRQEVGADEPPVREKECPFLMAASLLYFKGKDWPDIPELNKTSTACIRGKCQLWSAGKCGLVRG